MKKLFIFLAFIILINSISGQGDDLTWTLSGTINGGSYVARDWVYMGEGTYTYGSDIFQATINESLIYDVVTQSPVDPDTRPINTSFSVGTTSGVFNVTPSGAATYQVPIFVSPGTAGVLPNVSIVYNSQGGNGVLGWGWNIAGLSAITRVPKNIYNDGENGGVNLNSEDRFALDGNRLLSASGVPVPYGQPGSQYNTEIETFVKVTAYGTAGTGPSYFIVQTKDGSTLEYGNTDASKVEAYETSTVLMWRLNKATDANGNYMEYYYGEAYGESYITKIKYTGNSAAGINPYNEVNFYYESRNDISKGYIAGSQIQQTLLLRKIGVKYEDEIIREYEFKYCFDSFTKLNEIKEFGKDESQLHSTIVEWGTRTPSLETNTPTYYTNQNVVGSGDFNGDGQTDYVAFFEASATFKFLLANAQGTDFTDGYSSYLNSDYVYIGFYIADLNGDAKDDVIFQYFDDKNNSDPSDDIYGYVFHVSYQGGHQLTADNITYGYDHVFLTGDFTGDGLGDCIVADPNQTPNRWYMYSYQYDGSTLNPLALRDNGTDVEWFGYASSEIKRVPIDYNGNGKLDIIILDPYGYDIIEYNGSDFLYLFSDNNFTVNDKYAWGDFNGDGNTDFYYNRGSGGKIRFSKGMSYTEIDCPVFNSFSWSYNNYYSQDMNGDGLSDLVAIGRGTAGTGTAKLHVALSLSTTLGSVITYTPDPTLTLSVSDTYNQFGDFNGDGNIDYLYSDNSISRLFNLYQGKSNMLVQSVTNGFNSKTAITYKPMTDDNNFYTKGAYSTFPVNTVQLPLYMVSSASGNNGVGGVNTIDYRYETAKIHRQGKGFLGIMKFTSSNATANIKTIQNFGYNSTFFNSYLTSTETATVTGGWQFSTLTNTNQVRVLDVTAKRFFPYVSHSVAFDNVTNTTVTNDYTYDNYGNLTNKTTHQGGDVTTAVVNVYNLYGGWGPLNKITRSTVTKTYTGQPAFTRITDFTYDSNGKLTEKIIDPGKTKAVTEIFTYSTTSCGQPLTSTIRATGITDRTSTFTYDPKYRFVVTKTNVLSHTVTSGYDFGLGLVTSEKDINGLTTQYAYDGFGGLMTTTLPTGKVINSSSGWIVNNPPANARYYTTSSSPGSPSSTTYYDILGRDIRNVTTGFEGTSIYQDKEYYEEDGNLYRTSNPYTSSPLWTTYTYDYFKRVDLVTTPTCSLDYSYIYGKTVNITDCNGRTTSKSFNNAGEVISSSDDGSSISYWYHSSGQVRQINAAGSVSTMAYDEYGMQTNLIDPDAGTTSYTYNAFGELLTQTNARSQETSLSYDVLGRVQTKTSPEGTVAYTYDNALNGIGAISSVSGTNNSVTYSYDEFSRVSSETNTIEGTPYTTSYTYDNVKGRVSQVVYPSQFAIINEYDDYGYLKRVKRNDNQNLIWECTGTNNYGQVTGATLGNTLSVTRGYDQYGFPTSIQTGTVQNMQFSFNTATGNLTWRKDNLTGRGFTENFFFDEDNKKLDRLTNCQVVIGGVTNNYPITYQNNGNISTKHDAGTYVYGGPRPHAVTQLASSPMNDLPQNITYNSFEKPVTITQESKNLTITYGVDEQRIKSVFTENSTNWTRKYIGNYEEEWVNGQCTKKIHYISGGDGLAAIYVIYPSADLIYYVSKDYIGNILLLTQQDGSVVEEYSFDAWGRRRSPTNWNNYNVAKPYYSYRGYTGHEHLDEFVLINMNGRCYDPITARFLSPDNYVQDPLSTQSYNRYSYCLNNPLKYYDPDGEWFQWLIGGIIGAIQNVIKNWDDIDGNFIKFNQYAFVGCVAGSTASFLSESGVGAPGVGMATGWLLNTGNAYIRGADFYQIMEAGTKGALVGGTVGFVSTGVSSLLSVLGEIHWTSNENYGDLSAHQYHEVYLKDLLNFGKGSSPNYIASQVSGDASIVLATYYQPTPRELDPITEHLEESISLSDFINSTRGMTLSEIGNQINMRGNPSGLRYIINPNDNNVIDMRHMLFVGYKYGGLGGKLIEFGQWVLGDPSGMNAQDFYSNRLGSNFSVRYGTQIMLSPKKTSLYLEKFFAKPRGDNHKYRGSIWF